MNIIKTTLIKLDIIKSMSIILICSLLLSSVQAGSGAGGIIRVKNETDKEIWVTWSGTGCAGTAGSITLVCEDSFIKGGKERTYKYNWGVTDTWLNISIAGDKKHNFCYAVYEGTMKHLCIVNHYEVDTKAWKTDVCVIKNREGKDKYVINCIYDR